MYILILVRDMLIFLILAQKLDQVLLTQIKWGLNKLHHILNHLNKSMRIINKHCLYLGQRENQWFLNLIKLTMFQ